jgi:hypothetical protein
VERNRSCKKSDKEQCTCIKNKQVQVLSDNKNVKSILLNGSKIPSIQKTALDLDIFCENESIVLCPEWIPRGPYELADYLRL